MRHGNKATITHYPDDFAVIAEADSEGKRVLYLRFVGQLLGKVQLPANTDLQFALDQRNAIDLLLQLQTAMAWFHPLLTPEQKARIAKAAKSVCAQKAGKVRA